MPDETNASSSPAPTPRPLPRPITTPPVPRGRKKPDQTPPGWEPLPRCQGHNRGGTQCRNNAMDGKRVCYNHGGATPTGPAHGAFKTGKYSQALPNRLLETYHTTINDPNLLDLTDDIGVLTAHQKQILRGLSTGEGGELWPRLQDANNAIHAAIRAADAAAMQAAMSELTRLIQAGIDDEEALKKFNALAQEKRKLVQAESHRRIQMRSLMTVEQLVAILRAYTRIVFRHVKDPKTLTLIGEELKEVTAQVRAGQALAA